MGKTLDIKIKKMKKSLLMGLMLLAASAVFAQTKPKSMKEIRDSVFTSLSLSAENKQKMHDLILEVSKAKAEITKDASLTAEEKKAKLEELSKAQSKKEQEIMTPEQRAAWAKFAKEYKRPKN